VVAKRSPGWLLSESSVATESSGSSQADYRVRRAKQARDAGAPRPLICRYKDDADRRPPVIPFVAKHSPALAAEGECFRVAITGVTA
jgi:hypothetical protein